MPECPCRETYNGTVTDLDGNYTLMVSSPEATLTFTFIGQTADIALSVLR